MKVFDSIEKLIGNTPLLELKNIEKELNLDAKIIAKLEMLNPGGSIKDRAALFMLNEAIDSGKIKEGGLVIEPTSGNTGIGIAMISASKNLKSVFVMPDTMSIERIKLLKSYGAEVVLTEGKLGMSGAIEKAEEIHKNNKNSFIVGQFSNPENINAHYFTTAREIYSDLDGAIDYFVAGIGSGGTISGVGKHLKEQNENILVIGVEPESSPLISKGQSGKHLIQGIGANFIPKNYVSKYVDKVLTASNEDAYNYANLLAKKEGVLAGISSGASLSVAISLARDPKNKGKNIVVVLPDTGTRYLSTDLFN